MIEYLYQEGVEPCSQEPLKVRMDGKICGEIRKVALGYQYFPKHSKMGGLVLPTIDAVQKSLDMEE